MKIKLQNGKGTLTLDGGHSIPVTDALKKQLSANLAQSAISTMSDSELRTYLSPVPEDYVLIPWRALSATSVQSDRINFGHNGGAALREAVPLFNDLILLKNHDQNVDSWLGKTQGAYWDDQTPNIPPGVNFMLNVDTKADPKVARGLMTGMLTSGSVTIQFDYDKSHPKLKDDEFYYRMGETIDGKLVQANVTKINRNLEYSVVWQGADQFAKGVDDNGDIVVPGTTSNSLSHEENNMEFLKKLAIALGLPETASEADVLAAQLLLINAANESKTSLTLKLADLTTRDTELTATKAEVSAKIAEVATLSVTLGTLTAERDALKLKVEGIGEATKLGEAYLTSQREDAPRLYNLCEGDKASKPMQDMIATASLDVAKSLVSSYNARLEKDMPMSCTACGKTELSRRVSKSEVVKPDTNVGSARMSKAVSSIHD